ncbi:DUF2834 domain-containing protein [Endothiovibrio diazotrophicus]
MKRFYLVLCVVGLVAPYSQFVPWFMEHGVAPVEFVRQALVTRISLFAWMDVVVSAAVVFGFIFAEGRRLGMRGVWGPVLGTFLVGVSFGLPLFLLARESRLEAERGGASS